MSRNAGKAGASITIEELCKLISATTDKIITSAKAERGSPFNPETDGVAGNIRGITKAIQDRTFGLIESLKAFAQKSSTSKTDALLDNILYMLTQLEKNIGGIPLYIQNYDSIDRPPCHYLPPEVHAIKVGLLETGGTLQKKSYSVFCMKGKACVNFTKETAIKKLVGLDLHVHDSSSRKKKSFDCSDGLLDQALRIMVAHQAIFTISMQSTPPEIPANSETLTKELIQQEPFLHNGLKGHVYNLLAAQLTLDERYYKSDEFKRIKDHVLPNNIDGDAIKIPTSSLAQASTAQMLDSGVAVSKNELISNEHRRELGILRNQLTARKVATTITTKLIGDLTNLFECVDRQVNPREIDLESGDNLRVWDALTKAANELVDHELPWLEKMNCYAKISREMQLERIINEADLMALQKYFNAVLVHSLNLKRDQCYATLAEGGSACKTFETLITVSSGVSVEAGKAITSSDMLGQKNRMPGARDKGKAMARRLSVLPHPKPDSRKTRRSTSSAPASRQTDTTDEAREIYYAITLSEMSSALLRVGYVKSGELAFSTKIQTHITRLSQYDIHARNSQTRGAAVRNRLSDEQLMDIYICDAASGFRMRSMLEQFKEIKHNLETARKVGEDFRAALYSYNQQIRQYTNLLSANITSNEAADITNLTDPEKIPVPAAPEVYVNVPAFTHLSKTAKEKCAAELSTYQKRVRTLCSSMVDAFNETAKITADKATQDISYEDILENIQVYLTDTKGMISEPNAATVAEPEVPDAAESEQRIFVNLKPSIHAKLTTEQRTKLNKYIDVIEAQCWCTEIDYLRKNIEEVDEITSPLLEAAVLEQKNTAGGAVFSINKSPTTALTEKNSVALKALCDASKNKAISSILSQLGRLDPSSFDDITSLNKMVEELCNGLIDPSIVMSSPASAGESKLETDEHETEASDESSDITNIQKWYHHAQEIIKLKLAANSWMNQLDEIDQTAGLEQEGTLKIPTALSSVLSINNHTLIHEGKAPGWFFSLKNAYMTAKQKSLENQIDQLTLQIQGSQNHEHLPTPQSQLAEFILVDGIAYKATNAARDFSSIDGKVRILNLTVKEKWIPSHRKENLTRLNELIANAKLELPEPSQSTRRTRRGGKLPSAKKFDEQVSLLITTEFKIKTVPSHKGVQLPLLTEEGEVEINENLKEKRDHYSSLCQLHHDLLQTVQQASARRATFTQWKTANARHSELFYETGVSTEPPEAAAPSEETHATTQHASDNVSIKPAIISVLSKASIQAMRGALKSLQTYLYQCNQQHFSSIIEGYMQQLQPYTSPTTEPTSPASNRILGLPKLQELNMNINGFLTEEIKNISIYGLDERRTSLIFKQNQAYAHSLTSLQGNKSNAKGQSSRDLKEHHETMTARKALQDKMASGYKPTPEDCKRAAVLQTEDGSLQPEIGTPYLPDTARKLFHNNDSIPVALAVNTDHTDMHGLYESFQSQPVLVGRAQPTPKPNKKGRVSASELLTWCVQQHKHILSSPLNKNKESGLPSIEPVSTPRTSQHGKTKDVFINFFVNCPPPSAASADAERVAPTTQTELNFRVIDSIMHQGALGGLKRVLAGCGTAHAADDVTEISIRTLLNDRQFDQCTNKTIGRQVRKAQYALDELMKPTS